MIIEDELKIAEQLKMMLMSYDFDCKCITNFDDVIDQVKLYNPDIVLLDINLPKYDGFYLLRQIREYSELPVILVTSRDTDVDELVGMNLGADDFITKPYNNNILLARINRILKRIHQSSNSNIITHNGLSLNISNSSMSYNNVVVELTKNESQILEYMLNNKSKILSRNEIIECLWQSDQFIDDNTLTVNITRIRKKLVQIGIEDFIKTKRAQGYMV
jgi:DNA-binding response OmpR family regulator